jgi:hypothetical protein
MSKDDKLKLLSFIARSPDSNSSDIIKAIQAHTEISGETADGYKKLIIKIELVEPKQI